MITSATLFLQSDCGLGCYLGSACLELDADWLRQEGLVLGGAALDPALAPGAGGDGGDEVDSGRELHFVFQLSGNGFEFGFGKFVSVVVQVVAGTFRSMVDLGWR